MLTSRFQFKSFFFALLLCAGLAVPVSVLAQAVIPPAGESGISQKSLQQSQPKAPPLQSEIPSIVIEDSRQVIDPGAGPTFLVREILIQGNTLISDAELQPVVESGLGNEVTVGILDLIAQEITAEYIKRGYFLTRAFIPQQEIVDGVVRVRVMEGRIDDISFQGNRKTDTADLEKRLTDVRREKIIREKTLERTLLELNDIQGLHVESTLKPGKLTGTSDLLIHVEESRPWTFSFDGDNYGSSFTGANRFGVTTTYSSALKLGDLVAFRGIRSENGQTFLNPSYALPLSDNGRTALRLSYIYSEHQLGAGLTALRAGGSSQIFSMDLTRSLLRSRSGELHLGGGMDFRYFKNYQLFQASSDDALFNFHLLAGGYWFDPLRGQTSIEGRLQVGFTEGDRGDPLNSRLLGRGNSVMGSINVTRYQSAFFLDSFFMMRFNGQVVDRRVLSPDQMAIGGIGTVRGFPLAEIAGDSGYSTTLEYVLPLPLDFPVTPSAEPTLKQLVSLFGFIDHGRTFISSRQPSDGPSENELSGAGGGFRLNIPRRDRNHPAYNFSFAYAVPVFSTQNPSDGSSGIVYLGGQVLY